MEQTRVMVDAGFVPIFISLLMTSPVLAIKEQAMQCLGEIASCPEYRDFVLKHDVLPPLLQILEEESNNSSIVRRGALTLSLLCRGKPQPPYDLVKTAIPTLARLINNDDVEAISDACWALSFLSDGDNDRIQTVCNAQGLCSRLVELLDHPSFTIQTPTVRTVGNIVSGDEHHTQLIIDCGALPLLNSLVQSSKRGIKKEACWVISNIAAGNKSQKQAVIDAGLTSTIVHLLSNADNEIKKEAAWVIANLAEGGSPDQVKHLVQLGAISSLCDLLTNYDDISSIALEVC